MNLKHQKKHISYLFLNKAIMKLTDSLIERYIKLLKTASCNNLNFFSLANIITEYY